ncbi:MAG: hypothetical protein AAF738_10170, partial [Bacteroidota bacterium]
MKPAYIIGLGLLAYLLLNRTQGANAQSARQFRLPDGRIVSETQLPSLGYIKVPYEGRTGWISVQKLNRLTRAQRNGQFWTNLIRSVQTGSQLVEGGLDAWQDLQNALDIA